MGPRFCISNKLHIYQVIPLLLICDPHFVWQGLEHIQLEFNQTFQGKPTYSNSKFLLKVYYMSTSMLGAKGESEKYIKYNPFPPGAYSQDKHP